MHTKNRIFAGNPDITGLLQNYLDKQIKLDDFFKHIKNNVLILLKEKFGNSNVISGRDPNINTAGTTLLFFTAISSRHIKPEYMRIEIPLTNIRKIMTI